MTTLGTATADPGELATGRLAVGETRDGSRIGLPVAVIEGAADGPTLYLQAASDGDELNGVGVISRLVPTLDPGDLSGTILIVGIVNYHAYQAAEHRNPIDDTKLNRAYPGDPTGSSSERIAHATYEIASDADVALDLHQGSTSCMIEEVRVRCGRRHRLHEECLELARAFDAGYVLDQKGPNGQLARCAPDDGVPTVDPELGGSVGFDEGAIRRGVEGVRNVLRLYDMLDGSPPRNTQVRAAEFDRYGAPVGGLVRLESELGTRVEEGDVLYEVTTVFGEAREAVTARSPGILWRSRRLPHVATGEYVCSVGTDVDEI